MLKPVIDFFKPIVSAYRRLMQAEDNIKKLGERANKHEDGQRVTEATLIEVLHQLDKDRAVAIEQRRTAERACSPPR